MIKISRTSKLDGISSWSLQALETCPAAKKRDGTLVDACKVCYAVGGNYRFPNVKAPRNHNREDWKRDDWVADMVAELDNHRYFRWFDSGDMYHTKLAEKIYEVMQQTQWVKHWLPTRMYKFPKFVKILSKMNELPNVTTRLSSDSIRGDKINFGAFKINSIKTSSTIVPSVDSTDGTLKICEAYENDGKCGKCRACWDKTVETIAYVAHGKAMSRLIASDAA